jgi:hypothetical protein
MQGEAERLQQFARTRPISTTINSHERRLSRCDCPGDEPEYEISLIELRHHAVGLEFLRQGMASHTPAVARSPNRLGQEGGNLRLDQPTTTGRTRLTPDSILRCPGSPFSNKTSPGASEMTSVSLANKPEKSSLIFTFRSAALTPSRRGFRYSFVSGA